MFRRQSLISSSFLFLVMLYVLTGCDSTVKPPDPPDVQRVDRLPAWSPDGRYVAYLHDAGPTEDTTAATGRVCASSPFRLLRTYSLTGLEDTVFLT